MTSAPSETTVLLKRWSAGDEGARDQPPGPRPFPGARVHGHAESARRPGPGPFGGKRGGGEAPLELNETLLVLDESLERETELHEALTRLAAVSPRQSFLLQYCYFGGLSREESALAAGVSLATAKRDLRAARAWLASQLQRNRRPDRRYGLDTPSSAS